MIAYNKTLTFEALLEMVLVTGLLCMLISLGDRIFMVLRLCFIGAHLQLIFGIVG